MGRLSPADSQRTVFSPGCRPLHRALLLRSDNTVLLSSLPLSLGSPHPLPPPLSHSLFSAGSTASGLILFSPCCSVPSLVYHTVFLVVLHLASQRDVKAQSLSSFLSHTAKAHRPHLFPVSPSLHSFAASPSSP